MHRASSRIQFVRFSNEALKRIFAAYQQFSNVDIEQTIKTETDVELSRSLMAIGKRTDLLLLQ